MTIRKGFHRVALLIAIVFTSIAGFAAIRPGVAWAASCSGYGCDHQDPVATGCSNGSYTVTSAPITFNGGTYGTVELRWSPTCQTNWSRVSVAAGGSNPNGYLRMMQVVRQNPYAFDTFRSSANGSPIYGNMLYAPGCAKAIGTIQIDPYNSAYGQAVQPGCNF